MVILSQMAVEEHAALTEAGPILMFHYMLVNSIRMLQLLLSFISKMALLSVVVFLFHRSVMIK